MRSPAGMWFDAGAGRDWLVLDRCTRYGAWWAYLVLKGPDGRRLARLLVRDQFDPAAWDAFVRGLGRDQWIPYTGQAGHC